MNIVIPAQAGIQRASGRGPLLDVQWFMLPVVIVAPQRIQPFPIDRWPADSLPSPIAPLRLDLGIEGGPNADAFGSELADWFCVRWSVDLNFQHGS